MSIISPYMVSCLVLIFFNIGSGLWPERNDSSWPQYCPGKVWDETTIKKINKLLPKMNKLWMSAYGDNFKFWRHEWDKHGTCAIYPSNKYTRHIKTLFEYFNTTLNLRERVDLISVLKSNGITPSGGGVKRTFKLSNIITAIKDKIGVNPAVKCTKGYLDSIYICVDKKSLKVY